MNKQDYKILIIGAGVSGLIASTVLEQYGFSPVIIEATDRVGGRVKTDIVVFDEFGFLFQNYRSFI